MGVLDVENLGRVGNVEELRQAVALPHRLPWRPNMCRKTEFRALTAALVMLR